MKNFKLYKSDSIHDLREMLERSCSAYPDKPVFLQKENGEYTAHTYGEFYCDVNSLGVTLLRRGLKGKRVIVLGENSYAWCVAYMAVVCGVGTVVPVDKEIPAEELANIAKLSSAGAIIYSEKYEEKAKLSGKRIQKISFGELLKIGRAHV